MREIIDFIRHYSTWFVFTFYVLLSLLLLFNNNPYQRHVYMTSAGAVSASVYGAVNNVTSYFGLRQINDDLQQHVSDLETEILSLRKELTEYKEASDTVSFKGQSDFTFIVARVINNSIAKPHNFITIDAGSEEGIRPEMGVIDHNGVVGVVDVVGKHHSRVISLLNPDLHLSCKLKGKDFFGSLVWDGNNCTEALLEEMPKHGNYAKGDIVVTSGFSAIFPKDIKVGKVIAITPDPDGTFVTLRVKLSTDFARLSTVRVIENSSLDDIMSVESVNED